MSCGAFGGSGSCGGGGGGAGMGVGGGDVNASGIRVPRHYAGRQFFDPFCIPPDKKLYEPSCYFNPFVHAQCLGVNMNMESFRNDILKCQEDYKKAVWAVLKKYAAGEGEKGKEESNNANSIMFGGPGRNNGNNFGASSFNFNNFNAATMPMNMGVMDAMAMGARNTSRVNNNPAMVRRSVSSGFQFDDPSLFQRMPMNFMPSDGGPMI